MNKLCSSYEAQQSVVLGFADCCGQQNDHDQLVFFAAPCGMYKESIQGSKQISAYLRPNASA